MKKLVAICLGLAILLPGVAGCSNASKKPITQPRTGRITQPNTINRTRTTTPGTMPGTPGTTPGTTATDTATRAKATKMANEAKKVKGVKGASVAISGNSAYVGIDLAANVKGKMTDTMKKDVAKKVKAVDKRIKNVYVTSDVGLVTRIKNVVKGTTEGRPISSFASELTEIGRRITPGNAAK